MKNGKDSVVIATSIQIFRWQVSADVIHIVPAAGLLIACNPAAQKRSHEE